MEQEPLLDFVLRGLESHRGSWPEISKVTRIPYSALCKLAQRQHQSPRLNKLERLAQYFRRAA